MKAKGGEVALASLFTVYHDSPDHTIKVKSSQKKVKTPILYNFQGKLGKKYDLINFFSLTFNFYFLS